MFIPRIPVASCYPSLGDKQTDANRLNVLSQPDRGAFQMLEDDPANHCGSGLKTEFGPGDPGYKGGRWVTGGGDRFMCPLIGGGYEPGS